MGKRSGGVVAAGWAGFFVVGIGVSGLKIFGEGCEWRSFHARFSGAGSAGWWGAVFREPVTLRVIWRKALGATG